MAPVLTLFGFSWEGDERPRTVLRVSCLDRTQKAFGVLSHAALGRLIMTTRRVVFLDDDNRPLFEAPLERLVAGYVSPPGLLGDERLVLRTRDAQGREESVRFRHGEEEPGIVGSALEAWLADLTRLMRERGLALEST